MISPKKKTKQMIHVEEQYGKPIEEVLRNMYVDGRLGIDDISALVGVSYVTAHGWLSECNITSRGWDW